MADSSENPTPATRTSQPQMLILNPFKPDMNLITEQGSKLFMKATEVAKKEHCADIGQKNSKWVLELIVDLASTYNWPKLVNNVDVTAFSKQANNKSSFAIARKLFLSMPLLKLEGILEMEWQMCPSQKIKKLKISPLQRMRFTRISSIFEFN